MEKFGFQLIILFSFDMFATQINFITQGIVLRLDSFIVNLFLKFLGMIKILLVNGYKVLEFRRLFFCGF